MSRLQYYRRIFQAYLGRGHSHLTFWHDEPEANPRAPFDRLGEYYMPFLKKADYAGPRDADGIPMLDYRGSIGLQYNPIAIAQWGLGNFNLFVRSGDKERRRKFLAACDWLCDHLEQNSFGVWIWNHHFDWEYRTLLRAPWCSALAQGQGISLLLRAHLATGNPIYKETADRAFGAFCESVEKGGVTSTDSNGNLWLEE